ncbi:thiaminase II [Secundilactobacillus yichangensis]|uniref:thiaminase II n=1 Tax=Secundilactobacillus yichangensis TaxID=2799580 RepID=UPI0019427311|nr:thiaminase II [Secundilactobacillus yichangensis]
MDFSTELIEAGTPILDHIMEHPFVKGIGAGHLAKEALMFYVTQDYNYLNEFLHSDAVALLKSTSREDMQIISQQIDFLLNSESEAHKNFCEVAGTSYKSLQGQPMTPTTKLYTNHMLETLKSGDLIDIIAAMTPCPWTYGEIGNRLIEQGKNTPDNVFTAWIELYADTDDDDSDGTPKRFPFFDILDREAPKYSRERLDQVKRGFLESCEFEWDFWEQSYYQKDWQFLPGVELPVNTVAKTK